MRIEGQKKLGFYPTPDNVVQLARTYLEFGNNSFNALDPCCGKGQALRDLVQDTNGLGYGIEINEKFVPEAKARLYKVACGGYETARITNGGFSVLYLNPPFDYQAGSDEEKSVRKELRFLKDTWRYLAKGGLLIYIIQQHQLTQDVAKVISYRFRKIQVFRFPDTEYEAFGQIILFGILKEMPIPDEDAMNQILACAAVGEAWPVIAEAIAPEYTILPTQPVSLFRGGVLDHDEVLKDMSGSRLVMKFKQATELHDDDRVMRPITRTHAGHDALLLASGYANGVLGSGLDRHLVCGRVVKNAHESYDESTDKEGNAVPITKVVESNTVNIVVRERDGEIRVLM